MDMSAEPFHPQSPCHSSRECLSLIPALYVKDTRCPGSLDRPYRHNPTVHSLCRSCSWHLATQTEVKHTMLGTSGDIDNGSVLNAVLKQVCSLTFSHFIKHFRLHINKNNCRHHLTFPLLLHRLCCLILSYQQRFKMLVWIHILIFFSSLLLISSFSFLIQPLFLLSDLSS